MTVRRQRHTDASHHDPPSALHTSPSESVTSSPLPLGIEISTIFFADEDAEEEDGGGCCCCGLWCGKRDVPIQVTQRDTLRRPRLYTVPGDCSSIVDIDPNLRPALMAPPGAAQPQSVTRGARDHILPFMVRGGAHDGYARTAGGVAICSTPGRDIRDVRDVQRASWIC